jgi:hypothetical protein
LNRTNNFREYFMGKLKDKFDKMPKRKLGIFAGCVLLIAGGWFLRAIIIPSGPPAGMMGGMMKGQSGPAQVEVKEVAKRLCERAVLSIKGICCLQ